MNCQDSRSLVTVLEKDFNEELISIDKSASRIGIRMPFQFKAKKVDTSDCPESFTDGLTYSVMDSPVLLKVSQVTVDEKTLVYLLLQDSPLCPFTRTPLHHDSFCRLSDLQQKIHAWRKADDCFCQRKIDKVEYHGNEGTKSPPQPPQ